MDSAADHLTAELLPRAGSLSRRVWSWAKTLLGAATGLGDGLPPVDLVIRRIPSGAEVMRTPADVGSPDFLLEQVRSDLQEMTVDEFLSEWRAE
ncbi:hypothetical protein FB562_2319 [Homoserinimonas aerilata]|uniref:Uncharacterized protein n=1 Tax=Homoserinimonas aerilata TaxID=1162970 RepID=A0A542YFP5_9MICO|nr:hypothetical protein [Homoserinimonas aerilata]TQL46794.1 hypothetical protein FB562_2319 [Homoserinimonas aerilata]